MYVSYSNTSCGGIFADLTWFVATDLSSGYILLFYLLNFRQPWFYYKGDMETTYMMKDCSLSVEWAALCDAISVEISVYIFLKNVILSK